MGVLAGGGGLAWGGGGGAGGGGRGRCGGGGGGGVAAGGVVVRGRFAQCFFGPGAGEHDSDFIWRSQTTDTVGHRRHRAPQQTCLCVAPHTLVACAQPYRCVKKTHRPR